jgi:hypothetical protein
MIQPLSQLHLYLVARPFECAVNDFNYFLVAVRVIVQPDVECCVAHNAECIKI